MADERFEDVLRDLEEGEAPTPEFVDSLRDRLVREAAAGTGGYGTDQEEAQVVTIEQERTNIDTTRRARWWAAAAVVLIAAIAVGLLAVSGGDDVETVPADATTTTTAETEPPVAPTTAVEQGEAIGVAREFTELASVGDFEGARQLTDGASILSARPIIEFIALIRMEVLDVECVMIDDEIVSCLAEVEDDWSREIGYDSQALWTMSVTDGVITDIDVVFSDDATTQTFFSDYGPAEIGEAFGACDDAACFSDLVRQHAADYAASEYYVEPTMLTLPEPTG